MIASINMDTGDIKLVSVYRDTYLNIGTDSYQKCVIPLIPMAEQSRRLRC